MGRRDQPELMPSDAELAADEAHLRRTLARYAEPAPVEPPAYLAARVLATLPAQNPNRTAADTASASPRFSRNLRWAGIAILVVALAVGAWGVLVNSLGPASVAGGPAEGLGQIVLLLTLAAKPLVNLLASTGAAAALVALTAVSAAWLWWRIVSGSGLELVAETR